MLPLVYIDEKKTWTPEVWKLEKKMYNEDFKVLVEDTSKGINFIFSSFY